MVLASKHGPLPDWLDAPETAAQRSHDQSLHNLRKNRSCNSLDMHTGGSREPAGTSGLYAKRPIPHRREQIAFFRRVQINRQTWEITVKQAPFISWRISHIRDEYWSIERGKEWRTPPLIPSWCKPEDPKTFLFQPADYPSTYKKTSRSLYGENNGSPYPAVGAGSSYTSRKSRVYSKNE